MEEYDEDEIGALDHEELEGYIQSDSKRLNALAEEFIESQQVQEWVLKKLINLVTIERWALHDTNRSSVLYSGPQCHPLNIGRVFSKIWNRCLLNLK